MATVSSSQFFGGKPAKAISPQTDVQEPGYLSRVAGDYMSAGQDIVDASLKGASVLENPNASILEKAGALGSTGLQAAGSFAGALFSPVTQAVKPALEATGLDKPVGEAVGAITDTAPVQAAVDFYKTLDPETQKNLEALYNIGTAVVGQKALNFGSSVAPGAIDAAGNVVSKGVSVTGKGLQKVAPSSESIMQRVARIPKMKQQAFEKTAGESVGSYLDKRGIYGNSDEILSKLSDRFVTHRNLADTEIAKLPGKYQDATVKNALKLLMEREKNVSLPGVLSPDFKKVQGLLSAYNKEGLTMTEINDVKRLFERNVKMEYAKTLGTAPEKVASATYLDSALRNWQFAKAKSLGLKNLDEINKETRLARQLFTDLGKEVSGVAGNNALGLIDSVLISGGDPAAIAMLVTKKSLGSKTVQSKIAELISTNTQKMGNIVPKTGAPKPTLQDFMSAKPSIPQGAQGSVLPSVDFTTLSPEVQRILKLKQ